MGSFTLQTILHNFIGTLNQEAIFSFWQQQYWKYPFPTWSLSCSKLFAQSKIVRALFEEFDVVIANLLTRQERFMYPKSNAIFVFQHYCWNVSPYIPKMVCLGTTGAAIFHFSDVCLCLFICVFKQLREYIVVRKTPVHISPRPQTQ